MKQLPTIGFIGLGIMGLPMAKRLVAAGYPLAVYARRAEVAADFAHSQSAKQCHSLPELAAQCTIVISIVSDTPDVESLVYGARGLGEHLAADSVFIDMSTISPTATQAMASHLQTNNIAMLDAPVSGGEQGAINGELTIMVGGKNHILQKCMPILKILGKTITHIGDNGAGQTCKSCNQLLVAQSLHTLGEVSRFAQASGVDFAKIRQALLGGFAQSRVLEVHGQRLLDDNFQPGFKLSLHQKDMNIVMETATELGIRLPFSEQVLQEMDALLNLGLADWDSASIARYNSLISENQDLEKAAN